MTQHYIGTKQIVAWPQEKDGKAGYAVKYEDGYTSWSPADVFEAAYLPMGHIGHLAPHQQRVVGDQVQIDDRIKQLCAFTGTSAFASLPEEERVRLDAQIDRMVAYSASVRDLIAYFPQPEQTYLQQDQGLEPVEYFALEDVAKLTEAERLGVFGYDPITEGSDKA